MGKFKETKKRIMDECGGPNTKKTFNETYFNELGTAMLNDADYEKTEAKNKGGELVTEKTKPVGELRKAIIGSVAKSAGCDAAEQERLVADHQFPRLPLYDYTESLVREYLSTGKVFQFARQDNFQAKLEMETVKAQVKDVRRPGATEKIKQRQGEHIKLKAKSTCPDNLKENL